MNIARLQELEYDLARVEELIERGDEFAGKGYPMAVAFNALNRSTHEIIKRKIKELQNNDEGRD